MDVAPQTTSMMAPLTRTAPENEANGTHYQVASGDQSTTNSNAESNSTPATCAPQPKVVQTAFIHKLYNMLEDQSIQHLISWSNSAESFVMSPSNDFSKVLSLYFKHTNISSFVRQLNMYGFHKVSDVFHTGSPETPMWEFKHGNGNFKRGDLVGLREIKRRASRHALVHRDSYSGSKPPPPQSGSSMDQIHSHQMQMHDSTEARLTNLEQMTYDLHSLLQKNEENLNSMHARNHALSEVLSRTLQLNHEMSRIMLSMTSSTSAPFHRDVANVQAEFQRQAEIIRSLDEHPEHPVPVPVPASRPCFSNFLGENGSVSPHQTPQEDSRRVPAINLPPRNNYFPRPLIPSLFPPTPHSLASNNTCLSTSSLRLQAPHYPPQSYPLSNSIANLSPPTNLARRHTSADIRHPQGWQTNTPSLTPGNLSSQWPSSPRRGTKPTNEEQHIRDSFSSYSLGTASSNLRPEASRPTTPPSFSSTTDNINTSWASGKDRSTNITKETSGPPLHRGIMAHILNPTTETTERPDDHDDSLRENDRKRRRIS